MTSAMERDTATSGGVNGSPQGQQLQDAASGLIEQATRTADAQASTTMTRVGETLETLAGHIRQAGEELRESQPQVAGLVDTAAERVTSAATYLRDRDASEAIENIQRMARNQPALVIGGGLAAGLIIGRLLRGGAEAGAAMSDRGPTGTGAYPAYGSTPGYGSTPAYGSTTVAGTVAFEDDALDDDEMMSDSATGDGVRDEAPTVRR
jgi:ElaB/YqjD/DUF883 family membrane-anchored ribosome-binding protein